MSSPDVAQEERGKSSVISGQKLPLAKIAKRKPQKAQKTQRKGTRGTHLCGLCGFIIPNCRLRRVPLCFLWFPLPLAAPLFTVVEVGPFRLLLWLIAKREWKKGEHA